MFSCKGNHEIKARKPTLQTGLRGSQTVFFFFTWALAECLSLCYFLICLFMFWTEFALGQMKTHNKNCTRAVSKKMAVWSRGNAGMPEIKLWCRMPRSTQRRMLQMHRNRRKHEIVPTILLHKYYDKRVCRCPLLTNCFGNASWRTKTPGPPRPPDSRHTCRWFSPLPSERHTERLRYSPCCSPPQCGPGRPPLQPSSSPSSCCCPSLSLQSPPLPAPRRLGRGLGREDPPWQHHRSGRLEVTQPGISKEELYEMVSKKRPRRGTGGGGGLVVVNLTVYLPIFEIKFIRSSSWLHAYRNKIPKGAYKYGPLGSALMTCWRCPVSFNVIWTGPTPSKHQCILLRYVRAITPCARRNIV